MTKCNVSCRAAVTAMALMLVAGCASKVPQAIREAPAKQPTVTEARQAPERYLGSKVRWGGELVAVTNLEGVTELEILARPLDRDGEPDPDAAADARFIARAPGFLDPAEYATGQRVTVAGVVAASRTGLVGEYRYRYPVVEVSALHRWPEAVPAAAYPYYPGPYYGWPWYDPWWPHRPYHRHPYW
jgi:outer membrane lipoprotein